MYKIQKLELGNIKYITLYLPEISRTSSSPQQLSVYADDNNHIVINRPSLVLISLLKNKCDKAKFEINGLKSRIKVDLIVSLCVSIITH